MKANRRYSGFSLVELLVVLAIVALLVAMLLPSLTSARAVAQSIACQTNLSQIGRATMTYGADNRDQLVRSYLLTAVGTAQGRFINGSDPFTGATATDSTLTGVSIPRAGTIRHYADVLMDGGYTTGESVYNDPGRPASFTLGVATDRRISDSYPAFRDRNDAGTTVAKFLVRGYGIAYQTSLMLDITGNNVSSVNKANGTGLTGSANTNWANATYRNAWNYYTAGSGVRHMRIADRPYPTENMWVSCIPGANGGPYSLTPWGYPQISPWHPSANPNGGLNSVFFDGHTETVRRDHVYAGAAAGPEAPTMNGTSQMRTAAGGDGNQWADPTIYPNFRPRFWDIRNTNPLGGTSLQNMDLNNMQTGTVTR